MKTYKILFATLVFALLFASCKKGHYDVSNVHGVVAQGELLLPVASQSFTVLDMMERFEVAEQVNWSEDGNMWFSFFYDSIAVISGSEGEFTGSLSSFILLPDEKYIASLSDAELKKLAAAFGEE